MFITVRFLYVVFFFVEAYFVYQVTTDVICNKAEQHMIEAAYCRHLAYYFVRLEYIVLLRTYTYTHDVRYNPFVIAV